MDDWSDERFIWRSGEKERKVLCERPFQVWGSHEMLFECFYLIFISDIIHNYKFSREN